MAGTKVAPLYVPSVEELAEYVRLTAEKAALESKARTIEKAADVLGQQIRAFVTARTLETGRPHVVRAGYLLSIVDGPRYPKWKECFVAATSAAAADKVTAETTPSKRLLVVPSPAE